MVLWLIFFSEVFKDEATPTPFVEVLPADPDGEAQRNALPDHIYMDCMGFGMGCCCLQVWNGGGLEWDLGAGMEWGWP